MRSRLFILPAMLFILMLGGCSSTVVNRDHQGEGVVSNGDSVIVLGRRDSAAYDTERSLIRCIESGVASGNKAISVIPEQTFSDQLYPWFEPRTAPKHVKGLHRMLSRTDVGAKVDELGVKYIIWVDGSTEVTNQQGSIACGIGPTGGGCFGLGTWDEEANYELSIWDVGKLEQVGGISAETKGTSYLPAVVIPIPLLARVQSNACDGLTSQLKGFFRAPGEAQK